MVTEVEIFKGLDNLWYYREKAANGEIIGSSEGYTRKHNAKRAAKRKWPSIEPVVV